MRSRLERWVSVQAVEDGHPSLIRLGVETASDGRTMFGVTASDQPPANPEDDGLSTMRYAVGDGFDPAEILERTRSTGWFVFHTGTGLKVSPEELEVAFRRLGLIDHPAPVQVPAVTVEELSRAVEVRIILRLEGAPAVVVGADTQRWLPQVVTVTYATWARWGPVWTLRVVEDVPAGSRARSMDIQAETMVDVPAWLTELVEAHRPASLDI